MLKKNIHTTHSFRGWGGDSFETRKKRARALLFCLRKAYPRMTSVLIYKTPKQMLAATMLSAQATDKKVNEVTQERGLFRKYKTVHDFASAGLSTFQKEIHSLGFFRQKAKNI